MRVAKNKLKELSWREKEKSEHPMLRDILKGYLRGMEIVWRGVFGVGIDINDNDILGIVVI